MFARNKPYYSSPSVQVLVVVSPAIKKGNTFSYKNPLSSAIANALEKSDSLEIDSLAIKRLAKIFQLFSFECGASHDCLHIGIRTLCCILTEQNIKTRKIRAAALADFTIQPISKPVEVLVVDAKNSYILRSKPRALFCFKEKNCNNRKQLFLETLSTWRIILKLC